MKEFSRVETRGTSTSTDHASLVDMSERRMFLEAVRGKHSLCSDAQFFGEVEEIIKERVRPMKEALEKIIEHQKMIGGSISSYSTIYRIANKALEDFR